MQLILIFYFIYVYIFTVYMYVCMYVQYNTTNNISIYIVFLLQTKYIFHTHNYHQWRFYRSELCLDVQTSRCAEELH